MNRMLATALSLLVCGCAAYSWRSGVPAEMRTVSVSTFRNESDLTELGAVAARQVLREFHPALTHGAQQVLQNVIEEFFDGNIAQATPAVMRLHFVQIGVG